MGTINGSRSRIVVLGAGFGGLNCALGLERHLGAEEVEVVLVDTHPYHLLTPALYLAGTGETANRAVCIPLSEILKTTGIRFQRGTVESIDRDRHEVLLDSGPLSYDTLVVALGNNTDYFGIPGLREHAIPFKSIYDAGHLRHRLKEELDERRNAPIKIVVGGGGFTGAELVGELAPALKLWGDGRQTATQNTIIEAGARLLPTLGAKVSERVSDRLRRHDVSIRVDSMIKSVSNVSVELSSGERLAYDILLWTGGVSGRDRDWLPGAARDHKGNYFVDRWLSLPDDGCFVLGDMAAFTDPRTGKPVPATAQTALEQARYLSANLARLHFEWTPHPYRPRHNGFLIPVIRRYAIIDLTAPARAIISGRIAFWVFEALMLRYLLGILPARKAWGHWRAWLRGLNEAQTKIDSAIDEERPEEEAA